MPLSVAMITIMRVTVAIFTVTYVSLCSDAVRDHRMLGPDTLISALLGHILPKKRRRGFCKQPDGGLTATLSLTLVAIRTD